MLNLSGLTELEAAAVKWQYALFGDFYTVLFKAIERADEVNLRRISMGFPIEVEAYRLYSRESGWWDKVDAKFRDNIESGWWEKVSSEIISQCNAECPNRGGGER